MVVLLAEDDPAHAVLIERELQRVSALECVHHVRNGEDALHYLNQQGAYGDPELAPRPHLILLDLNMPRMGGLELLGRVKGDSRFRSIPVVVLSTSAEESDVARCYDLHANSYLVKPVNATQLSLLVHRLASYWLHLNQTCLPTP